MHVAGLQQYTRTHPPLRLMFIRSNLSWGNCSLEPNLIQICIVLPLLGGEMPNGWPFGLGSMNSRLSVRERVEVVAADTREPNTYHGPSSSFSSFSSSNLDTESTASFFQDNSVSLGRLIGIRPRDNGRLYFPRPAYIPTPRSRHSEALPDADQIETSQGVCVPNLMNILVKISRSKSHSRH